MASRASRGSPTWRDAWRPTWRDVSTSANDSDSVDGYTAVPPPASVKDGGVDAEEASQLEDVAALDLVDQEEDAAQGTGRADG